MATIREMQEALQLVLGASATEQGLQSGWQRRRGQLSASQFVQTLVWGFLEAPEATLGQLAQMAHATGALVTPQALSQRFSPRSVALLRGVLGDALGLLVEAEAVDVPLLAAFPGGVYLDDSTQIALPDAWQPIWDGGGRAAALKVATLVDLLRGSVQVELTAARQHDSVTQSANLTFPAGAVVIEDLGYLDLERLQRRQAAGVGTIVPLRCTLALTETAGAAAADTASAGRRLDLLAWLRQQCPPGAALQAVEREVGWHGVRLRLVAVPAAPATVARKRAGIRAAAQRHGRAPHPRAVAFAEWIIALTTVPAAQATAQQIATLLRLRWQVEVLFKLWKDQGKVDETRGWNAARIETELYAKLLGVLLQHWVLLTVGGWQWANRSLVKAGHLIRAYARTLCLVWTDHAALSRLGDLMARSLAKGCRIGSHCHRRSAAFYAQSA